MPQIRLFANEVMPRLKAYKQPPPEVAEPLVDDVVRVADEDRPVPQAAEPRVAGLPLPVGAVELGTEAREVVQEPLQANLLAEPEDLSGIDVFRGGRS